MEIAIAQVVAWTRLIIAFIGIGVITFGALRAAFLFVTGYFTRPGIDITYIRLELGYSIILGLEFMVAADIIESLVKPYYYDIGILACLVLIRTFLSYVLTKELESLAAREKDAPK